MIKILAIDDNNDNLISLKAIIHDTFHEVLAFTALNEHAGIELAIAQDPDVVFPDVTMPNMDGLEVCHCLKQDERVREIPVVFLQL
jgi:CheY-like chemotaxis protein